MIYVMRGTRVGMKGYVAIKSELAILRENAEELRKVFEEKNCSRSDMIFLNETDLLPWSPGDIDVLEGRK